MRLDASRYEGFVASLSAVLSEHDPFEIARTAAAASLPGSTGGAVAVASPEDHNDEDDDEMVAYNCAVQQQERGGYASAGQEEVLSSVYRPGSYVATRMVLVRDTEGATSDIVGHIPAGTTISVIGMSVNDNGDVLVKVSVPTADSKASNDVVEGWALAFMGENRQKFVESVQQQQLLQQRQVHTLFDPHFLNLIPKHNAGWLPNTD